MSTAAVQKALPAFHCTLIAVAFVLATFRFFWTDSTDRYKCHALLNGGEWLDAGLTAPDSLNNWQPDGCMLVGYNEKFAKPCLNGRRVVFAGDSTARQLFYATAKVLDNSLQIPDYYSNTDPSKPSGDGKKHQDVNILAGGTEFEFIWDPLLNGTKVDHLFTSPRGKRSVDQIPAMLVIGTGLHFLREQTSGGVKGWSRSIDRILAGTAPAHERIADEVVLLPVQNTIHEKLRADRARDITNEQIDEMNADLMARLPPFTSSAIDQLSVPHVFNDMIRYPQAASHSPDGLHFDNSVTKAQATILLNLRCNDVLPKKFPFDKTCCNQYPAPNWLQAILLLVTLLWAPLGSHLYLSRNPSAPSLRFFPPMHVLTPMTIFGFSIIFMYFCDRTSLFLKVQKQFDLWQFTIAMILSLVLGVATMKKPEKDLGFLNRDQTDEWKGWMQIAILIYHYYGASKISGIYNPIRVLVAAYLFMSGYGHFTFYYKKADFGLARIAAVLVRLNLLTLVLAYIQDTDYLSYYFSPLTTLWFLIIWATMYVGNQYNKQNAFMVGKLAASAVLMTYFHFLDWPLKAVFGIFNTFLGTHWNAREWSFRVTLDMWIVYIGMVFAFAFIKISEAKLWEQPWWTSAKKAAVGAAALSMIGYFYFELQFNKLDYNHYHPFISFVPVIAFTILRNATPFLRSTSSKAYIWIGQCSLETFICQFHLWLGGDTKGLLVLLPWPRLRFLNMVFTTLIFLFLSNQIAVVTGDLSDWICGKKPKPKKHSAVALPSVGGNGPSGNYVPLSQLNGDGTMGNGTADDIVKPIAPPSKFSQALKSLPMRCAVLMGTIWVINVLYPADHPPQGHLLPLS